MSDRFDPPTGADVKRGPIRAPADDFSDPVPVGASRLPGVLISVVCVVAVCVLATWPRWHPAVAVVQLAPGVDAAVGTPEGAHPDATVAPAATAPAAATTSADAPAQRGAAPMAGSTVPADGAPHPAAVAPAAASTASAPTGVMPPLNAPNAKRDATRRPTLVRVPVSDDVPATWQALTPAQQDALQPFAELWPHLPDLQKRKWVAIASVYPRMSPEAQQRLHARMLRWTQMTGEQRKLARENYEMSRVLPPSARQQAWRAYEALPPAQRAKFAAAERRRQPLVVSAPPSEPHRTTRHTARPTPRGVTVSGASGASTSASPQASGQVAATPAAGASTSAAHAAATPDGAQTPPMQEPSAEQH